MKGYSLYTYHRLLEVAPYLCYRLFRVWLRQSNPKFQGLNFPFLFSIMVPGTKLKNLIFLGLATRSKRKNFIQGDIKGQCELHYLIYVLLYLKLNCIKFKLNKNISVKKSKLTSFILGAIIEILYMSPVTILILSVVLMWSYSV